MIKYSGVRLRQDTYLRGKTFSTLALSKEVVNFVFAQGAQKLSARIEM